MSVAALMGKILLVGHGLIGPDLPRLIESGLAGMGAPATVEAQIIEGAPLAWNWDHAAEADGVDGRAVLADGDVDALVLTEAVPLVAEIESTDTRGLVARWADLARETNPGVRVFLHETWPDLRSGTGVAIADDPGADQPWRERIEAEVELYRQVAGPGVGIIPAGQALGRLADEIAAGRVPGMTAITDVFEDDINLNGKGDYLVAMVHLAALTGRSPEGLPPRLLRVWPDQASILTPEQAAALQRIAWETVSVAAARPPVMEDRIPPDSPVFEPVSNPSLAIGVDGISDWSVAVPFLDLMKTARPWVGNAGEVWGGMEEPDLWAAGVLDADGWPLRMPPGVSGLSTLILTDMPEGAGGVAGRYVLTYEGRGDLQVLGRATVVSAAPGRVVFDYAPGEGSVQLTIVATDPGAPIRHIRVVRADREALLAKGEVFNPDWLARIRGVRSIRFMGWMDANDSTLSAAADRPKVDDYTWASKGVPVEVIVDLANRLQAEPWLTLPWLADDEFVTTYAEIVSRRLDPGLRVWVELSNEVWNHQFSQARLATEAARARWGEDWVGSQAYGVRAAEVMRLWTGVMPGNRVVRVVATQTGHLGLEEQILEAPLAVAEGVPRPADAFDAYAVTGYFSATLGSEETVPAVHGWIAQSEAAAREATAGMAEAEASAHFAAHRYDLAIEMAARELMDGEITGNPEGSVRRLAEVIFPYHAEVAARYGLKLVMYEGGTHVVGLGAATQDAALNDFFHALNYSPQMGRLYGEMMRVWAGVTDEPFMAFVDMQQPGWWGSWGAMRHLWDENPRWLALARGCDPC